MYYGVIDVEPANEFKLILTFENNVKKLFDMEPYLVKGIFKELQDKTLFDL